MLVFKGVRSEEIVGIPQISGDLELQMEDKKVGTVG